ncbi:MAG: alpha-L-rhamnosidase [Chloroflexi bacterium]|nr:alpha-L-rhamnosidase [Chloroflexota bacterium]
MSRARDSDGFGEIRWHGEWIWLAEEVVAPGGFWTLGREQEPAESHGLFRRVYDLAEIPESVPARITADSRYALYVNGHEVGRGPVRSQPRRLHYDRYDLAPYLRPGLNAISIYVKYYGAANSYWAPAMPNNSLGARGVLVFEARLEEGWLVSDASWRALKCDAWLTDWEGEGFHHHGVPIEVFDARRLDAQWKEAAFDDSAWSHAVPVPAMHIGGFRRTQPPTDPYGPLYPRGIAQLGGPQRAPVSLIVERLEPAEGSLPGSPVDRLSAALSRTVRTRAQGTLPIKLEPLEGVRLSMDMGRIVSGLVYLKVDAPAGTEFDLSFTEDPLTPNLTMDRMTAGARYIARGSDDRFQLFDSNGLRYIYLLVHGGAEPVTVRSAGVQEWVYPWDGDACFECDDEEINRIYAAGRRTVELNSHDAFIDCPTREQRAWVGDGVVHQMVHLATNADWRLARRFIDLGNSPRPDGILPMTVAGDIEMSGMYTIPDWSLHWVHGVYNLYRYMGDADEIKGYLPTVERILRWYAPYQTDAGALKDVTEWNLVDWSSVSTEDTSAALTGLWARGLREFAEMCGWLEERYSQRWAEGLYERARAGMELFWDEQRGSYVDHLVDGERRPEMTQIAGALAIVSRLAPVERWKRIVETITDPERLVMRAWTGDGHGGQSMEKWMRQVREGYYEIDWDAEREVVLAQPFMSYVVHDAVALAGEARRLPGLCRRWSQFLVNGYDTLGECWDYGTHVHGWSSTPTRDLVFYTLGVTPEDPGYTRARIAPRPGPLGWMHGRAPTPHGMIDVGLQPGLLSVNSPVPFVLDLAGLPLQSFPRGQHNIPLA